MVRTGNSVHNFNQVNPVVTKSTTTNTPLDIMQKGITGGETSKTSENVVDIPKDQLEKAIETLNNAVDVVERALEFSIHEDTNRIIVKVVDRSNTEAEVIREIPPERILDMVAVFMDMIGLMFDQRA